MQNEKIKTNTQLVTSTVPGKPFEGEKVDTRKKRNTKKKKAKK
tara:strand:- start:498 stop:626 length:129 start_codon:yes stop_codon:yes gene_type:complete